MGLQPQVSTSEDTADHSTEDNRELEGTMDRTECKIMEDLHQVTMDHPHPTEVQHSNNHHKAMGDRMEVRNRAAILPRRVTINKLLVVDMADHQIVCRESEIQCIRIRGRKIKASLQG